VLAPAPGTPSLADAVVDVFAFTVEVSGPAGELVWRYFGPNSHVVFGATQSREHTLPDLLAAHVHPDDAEAAGALVGSLRSGAPVETELRLVGADGVTRWVHWRGDPRSVEEGLFVDAVATDVTARRRIASAHEMLVERERRYAAKVDLVREHAVLVRDANDNVLQRLFATRLRLDMLLRKLDEADAHAVTTIAFQLDQASSDLRQVVKAITAVLEDVLHEEPELPETA
jgi:signal transduction histidine kinase